MASDSIPNESEILQNKIDNLFELLQEHAYFFLDRFHYPETDKKARAAYNIVNNATHELVKVRAL